MNKKFLKHYMETEPEGTSKKYIFLVDNQDIAMNIVMSGYQALYLGQEDDEYYFSVNSFIEDMRSIGILIGSIERFRKKKITEKEISSDDIF